MRFAMVEGLACLLVAIGPGGCGGTDRVCRPAQRRAAREPQVLTGARLNDVECSNRQFDGALTVAKAAPTLVESYTRRRAIERGQ